MTNKKEARVGGKPTKQAIKQVTSMNTTFNFKYLSGDGYGIVGGV